MREVEKDIGELYEPVRITEDYEGGSVFAHRAFGGIRFRPGDEVGAFRHHELSDDAYLRTDETSLDVEAERTYIKDHPLLARSFATFVPTSSIFLIDILGFLGFGLAHKLETWRPITVYDVLGMIHNVYVAFAGAREHAKLTELSAWTRISQCATRQTTSICTRVALKSWAGRLGLPFVSYATCAKF